MEIASDQIRAAIKRSGGNVTLAEMFGVTPQAVSQWVKTGMPAQVARHVNKETGVSLEVLAPRHFSEHWHRKPRRRAAEHAA